MRPVPVGFQQHPNWLASSSYKRTYVEGFFGTLKGDNAAGKNRGTSLYTGLAHESLEAAMFAVAANIRTLRTWHRKTGLGDPANPILHTEPDDIITAPIPIDDYQRLLDQHATQAA